jgi:hypothetical protein
MFFIRNFKRLDSILLYVLTVSHFVLVYVTSQLDMHQSIDNQEF